MRAFINQIKERAKGAEVTGALNPAQQVVKIVNDELINILGGRPGGCGSPRSRRR